MNWGLNPPNNAIPISEFTMLNCSLDDDNYNIMIIVIKINNKLDSCVHLLHSSTIFVSVLSLPLFCKSLKDILFNCGLILFVREHF